MTLGKEQAQALTRLVHLLPGEEWRPVVGFEEFYAVSSMGRVFSRPRERTPGGIMRGSLDGYGYRRVGLMGPDKKVRNRRIHVLVMRAFRGEPTPDAPVIRHLDGDKTNPALANLAYGTQHENGLDMVRHGNSHWANKTHCPKGHEYSPENTVRYDGRRWCVTCRRANGLAAYHRAQARLREASECR